MGRMKSKCDYYGKPMWPPYNCNDCPDISPCAVKAGWVRSMNPQDAETRNGYPWKDEMRVVRDANC